MVDCFGGGCVFFDIVILILIIYQLFLFNGCVIIVCFGGGYVKIVFDKEGSWVVECLLEDSIIVFVLKYCILQVKVNINLSLVLLQDV